MTDEKDKTEQKSMPNLAKTILELELKTHVQEGVLSALISTIGQPFIDATKIEQIKIESQKRINDKYGQKIFSLPNSAE